LGKKGGARAQLGGGKSGERGDFKRNRERERASSSRFEFRRSGGKCFCKKKVVLCGGGGEKTPPRKKGGNGWQWQKRLKFVDALSVK